jgi:cytochrome c oxidase subunit I+III
VKFVILSVICGILAIASCLVWVWGLDPEPGEPVEVGGGIKLPIYRSGPTSHAWWAMVVLMLVAGSLFFAYVLSYLYLWTVSPSVWAPVGSVALPAPAWPLGSAALFIGSAACFRMGDYSLAAPGRRNLATPLLLVAGAALSVAGVAVDIAGLVFSGLSPSHSSYGAIVYLGDFLTGQIVFAVAIMACFTVARHFAGRLDRQRRITFESTALLAYYGAGQGLVGLVLVHGFPRLV